MAIIISNNARTVDIVFRLYFNEKYSVVVRWYTTIRFPCAADGTKSLTFRDFFDELPEINIMLVAKVVFQNWAI